MGIGSTISGMMNKMANSMATITNSYIYTGSAIQMAGALPNNNSRWNASPEVYYPYLRSYPFVSAILDIFASTIIETLMKTNMIVSIKGSTETYVANECNAFLYAAKVKDYINTHIYDFIYRGQYSVGLDTKENKLIDIIDPYCAEIILEQGEIFGCRINNKLIPREKIATYYYKAGEITPIFRGVEKNSEMVRVEEPDPVKGYVPKPTVKALSADQIKKSKKNSLDDIKVEYSRFQGESIFKNQLSRIFQMYVDEYLLYYLGLRDSVQPKIIGMSTGGKGANVAQSLTMSNQVEGLLNQSTQGLNNIVDPLAFMNNLTFQILNYVRVVPSVDQYQSLNEIEANVLEAKRGRLQQEKEQIQQEILNYLTIPAELFQGQSNRWEMMSRNDRFMTTCDYMLKSVARFVKDICISVARSKGCPLRYDDVQFNLDCASMLTAYDIKEKVSKVADKLGELERMSQSIMNLTQMDLFKPEDVRKYLKKQLAAVDEDLASLVNPEQPPPPPEEGGEGEMPPEDGGEGGAPLEGDPGSEAQYQNPNM